MRRRETPWLTSLSFLMKETRQPVEDPVRKVLRTGAVAGLANHTILRSKQGTEIPIDDSAAPIRDAAGRLQGSVVVFRDITARGGRPRLQGYSWPPSSNRRMTPSSANRWTAS